MSTKIYNGLLVDRMIGSKIHKINDKIKELRSVCAEIVNREAGEFLVRKAIDLYDERFTFGNIPTDMKYIASPIAEAAANMKDRINEVKRTQRRDPAIDFSFEITFIPIRKRKMLGLYYCENRDLVNKMFSIPGFVSEYGYYDNSDMPDELTQRQWDQRNADWELALPDGIPINNGFTFKITNFHVFDILNDLIDKMEKNEIDINKILPVKKRISENARESAYNIFKGSWTSEEKEYYVNHSFSTLKAFDIWISISPGKEVMESEIERISGIIQEVDQHMLHKPYKDIDNGKDSEVHDSDDGQP